MLSFICELLAKLTRNSPRNRLVLANIMRSLNFQLGKSALACIRFARTLSLQRNAFKIIHKKIENIKHIIHTHSM